MSAIQGLLLSIEVNGRTVETSELSVISWMSTFQGCPLSGVPLYTKETPAKIDFLTSCSYS